MNFKPNLWWYVISAAQDRRQMLEEIMRRGTRSLGADVPSEREINRLAARSEEEFWLFEKMDEERRAKENYRARLMQEQEVPEWAYSAPENKEKQTKGFDIGSIAGKRRRREVVYVDTLSDLQWMKAVESGEDISKIYGNRKRRNQVPSETSPISNSATTEEKVADFNGDTPLASEGTSEDTYGLSSTPKRHKSEGSANMEKQNYHCFGASALNGQMLTWNAYKRKRSNYVSQHSSSNSQGQNSNGRGNGWA